MKLEKLFTKVIDWTNATETLKTSGDIILSSGSYVYLGDPDTDGTVRIGNENGKMSKYKRVDGNYVWTADI